MIPSSAESPFPKRRRLIVALLSVAAGLAGWLTWKALAGAHTLAGCGPAGGCSALLSSPYSRIFGVPVGALGLGVYLAALGAVLGRRVTVARWMALGILAGAAWFFWVQAFILKAFCPWCSVTHVQASAAAGLILGGLQHQVPFTRRKTLTLNALCFVGLFAGLAGIQVYGIRITGTHTQPGSVTIAGELLTITEKEELSLFGGKVVLDSKTAPMLGQRGFLSPVQAVQNPLMALMAPQPVIVLSDWTCPHCRALLATLTASKPSVAAAAAAAVPSPASPAAVGAGALVPAPGRPPLAVALDSTTLVLLPAWREEEGRALHSLMFSAWMGSEEAFRTLTAELGSGALAAAPTAVEGRIQALLGAERWAVLKKDTAPRVEEILKAGAEALKESDARLPEAVLPRLIAVNGMLAGAPSDADLATFLQSGGEALASQVEDVRKLSEPNGSRIEFESTAIETPPVVSGEKTHAVFHFTNTGTEPLNVVAVRTTCACTAISGWKQTVPPGGKGSITVDVDTAGHTNTMSRQLMVVVNAGNAPEGGAIPLRITARILPGAPAAGAGSGSSSDVLASPAPGVPRRQVH